jgi:hypothetical protein
MSRLRNPGTERLADRLPANNTSRVGCNLARMANVSSELIHPAARFESLVGRSVAMFVHPCAAWRSRPGATRLRLFVAYIVAGYLLSLGVLLLLSA